MNKEQIVRSYHQALADKKLRSETDFRAFLDILKEVHRQELAKRDPKKDFEQSWKGVKGRALEVLVETMLTEGLKANGLLLINDRNLPRAMPEKAKTKVEILKSQLLLDYGEQGQHLPDADLIVYREEPKIEVIAILSVKSSLRERIAQVAYWTGKTKIPYLFVTTDSDDDFVREISNKPRAIAEVDTDGVYVITENTLLETSKVKLFSRLVDDLQRLSAQSS